MDAQKPAPGTLTYEPCVATSKQSGVRCKRRPIPGGRVCVIHGGKAPQVQASAQERLMALQPLAIQTLHALMQREEYPTVQLGAARDVMDRTEGKAKETVDLTVKEAPAEMSDDALKARVAAIAKLLNVVNL